MSKAVVPDTIFHLRVRNPALPGPNPFEWKLVRGFDLFAGRRVVVFGLPGAFTPTCTNSQCPEFEALYDKMREFVDEVYCTSVNDAFVMRKWAESMRVTKVQMLPDGNGDFARGMGMLVDKSNLGFGARSWRYAMVVNNAAVEAMFEEGGKMDLNPGDLYAVSTPANVLRYLSKRGAVPADDPTALSKPKAAPRSRTASSTRKKTER